MQRRLPANRKEFQMNKNDQSFFGRFGGKYVAEILRPSIDELEDAFRQAIIDPQFIEDFRLICRDYIGRPTPLLHAENISNDLGGGQLYIKQEGMANTGAHKINNAAGQALLAKRMGKKRIIAETGAGQHGVATAAICAKLGLDCTVYMGEVDIARQKPNVYRMELFGAKVVPVTSGSKTLKDAVNAAMRDWASTYSNTHYLLGSALGPAPYPEMVHWFQSIIGHEVKKQTEERNIHIDTMIACVGGGSNAIGFFSPFIKENEPRLIGVEAGGRGNKPGEHASRMNGKGKTGIVQGYKSFFLQDDEGQLQDTHSISAGLDYAGIGPQLAQLGDEGRIEFTTANDKEVLEALKYVARKEGLIFALESAHAAVAAIKLLPTLPKDHNVVINMSGRGDKDIFITAMEIDGKAWSQFLSEEVKRYQERENK